MSRSKRTKEEEIQHLKKKLRKLEERTAETLITITGEYENAESGALRPENSAIGDSNDGVHTAEETPGRITSPSAPREPHVRSESRASLDAIEAHSSRSEPRANLKTVEGNSSKSEPWANVKAMEANNSRIESQANLNVTDAHSSRSEPRANRNAMDVHSSRNESRTNLNVIEEHSSRIVLRANLNVIDAHSSRSEPRANINAMEAHSSRSEPRANINAMEAHSSRSESRANLNDSNSSEDEPQAILNEEAHTSMNTPFRPQASLGAKIPKRNPGRPRASLDTSEANNSNKKNKKRTSSEVSQTDVALRSDNDSLLDRKEALLKALGDDLTLSGEFIHESLAQSWTTILRKGLEDNIKEKLFKEYAAPENCKALKAPTLNEEVAAVVEFQARNRDRILENKQNQLGLGITAIGRAITVLLKQGDNYEYNAMKHFNHGCRILLDLHYRETSSRRHLFKKDLTRSDVFRNLRIQNLERDETLFGNKVTKMVKKQGIPPTPIHQRPSSSSYGDPALPNRARNSNDPNLARDAESLRYNRRN